MRQIGEKGQAESMLIQIVKIMFGVLTIIIILHFSLKLGHTFFKGDKTPAEADFDRIAAEIVEMQKIEIMNIPVTAYDYEIKLIDKDNPMLPGKCKSRACACLYIQGSDEPEACESFKDFSSYKNPGNCNEKSRCLKDSRAEVISGTNVVTLTSKDYIIEIKS
ncbi:MAG: hypothetical protein U9R34_01085 [Nanoarchaeota archaeon]|nr:hypothetical protein [Nanoarchaeota archaeon]